MSSQSGEIGMDLIVQECSGLRKNYNLTSKSYGVWRHVAGRVCY